MRLFILFTSILFIFALAAFIHSTRVQYENAELTRLNQAANQDNALLRARLIAWETPDSVKKAKDWAWCSFGTRLANQEKRIKKLEEVR